MDNVNNLNGIENFGHGLAEGEIVEAGISDVPHETAPEAEPETVTEPEVEPETEPEVEEN